MRQSSRLAATDPNRVGAGIRLYGIEPGEAVRLAKRRWLPIRAIRASFSISAGRLLQASSTISPSEQRRRAEFQGCGEHQGYPAAQVALASFYWQGRGGFRRDAPARACAC